MDVLLNKNMSLHQTGFVYNPHLQKADMTEKLFVVRLKLFELLLNNILREKDNSIPQHYLIIGQRGMGKTTLLKRIEVELRKEKYQHLFIPLLYREEQYNVKDLSDFWLNTLDALADSLQLEKCSKERLDSIDKTIQELSSKTPEIISEEAYKFLMSTCRELRRRPVLLIDNIGMVFSRLDSRSKNKHEQWALRKVLSENGSPIFVSTGITVMDDVVNYNMPFYDFFQIQYLNKLNDNEFTTLLIKYAIAANCGDAVIASIKENTSRQKSLLALTGGSPRLTVMLFEHIVKGFSDNINDDLEKLADAITPLYKARFEELPTQQQVILDAIALNWDAISLKELSAKTRLKSNQLSPQLKRLTDDGWIETTPAYEAQGCAYFISERFFNIYYIIRNSSRRHKEKIYSLSKFLEYFYGKDDLEKISDILLKQDINSKEQMRLLMAIRNIEILGDHTREQLQNNILNAFIHSGNKDFHEDFDFPETDVLLSRGDSLSEAEQYEEAICYYDEVIKLNPNNDKAWLGKGDCLLSMKQYAEAVICYDKVIIYCDKNIVHCEEISVLCKENITRNQDNKQAKKSIGHILQMEKHILQARDGFLQAKSLFLHIKGLILQLLERYEEAVICYDEAIKLDLNNAEILEDKGYALVELKNYKNAVLVFEELISINPRNLLAKYHILFLYRDKLNEINKAVEIFNSITEEDLSDNENKDYIARFYLNKTLFELHKRNEGLAKKNLLRAFEILENEDDLLTSVNEYWTMQFACAVIEAGYGSWLLTVLEEKGYDILLSPYYTGIKAMEIEEQDKKKGKETAEIYLKNVAAEISVSAREIIRKIKKYMF